MLAPSIPASFGTRRFLSWNESQRAKHGGRVQKVSVDAGFTCPNRDGSKGIGGCTFCNNAGFTPSYLREEREITRQIETGLDFFSRRYPNTRHFVAYFQAYSNTYAGVDQLRTIYEAALAHPKIDGLVIGTRPDCVPDDVLDYLAELSRTKIVELELGVTMPRWHASTAATLLPKLKMRSAAPQRADWISPHTSCSIYRARAGKACWLVPPNCPPCR